MAENMLLFRPDLCNLLSINSALIEAFLRSHFPRGSTVNLPSNLQLKPGATNGSFGWVLRLAPGAVEPNEIERKLIHSDPEMSFKTSDVTRPIIFMVGLVAKLFGLFWKWMARLVRSSGWTWRTQSVIRFEGEVVGYPLYRFIQNNTATEWRGRSRGGPFKLRAFRLSNSLQSTEVAFVGLDGKFIPFKVDNRIVLIDDPIDDLLVADVPAF